MSPHLFTRSSAITLRTILGWTGTLLLMIALASYIAYQARFLIAGPQIVLEEYPDPTSDEQVIWLAGTANNITRITLNDRQIFTDPEGAWRELIVLVPGPNLITVAATDRFRRTATIEQTVVYSPPDSDPVDPPLEIAPDTMDMNDFDLE